ncbi:MAG: CHAT domain-containing protein [Scytonematopsis contorta HA4267-MV1]|jgi:CHAT domain-containing protein|nr:CHAT domain-containing protein [Scytonematopsis contorta HA4267-MV1]
MSPIIIFATLSQILNPFSLGITSATQAELPILVLPQKLTIQNFTSQLKAREKLVNTNQLQKGVQLYKAHKYLEAIAVLQEAYKIYYQSSEDKLNQAQTLNYLSLAYQQLGQLSEARTAINESLKLLENKTNTQEYLSIRAQSLNTYGQLQLVLGESEPALRTWEEATAIYTQIGDENGKIGSQINQAQALQSLGLYRRAKNSLDSVKQLLSKQPESPLKATALLSLGKTMRVVAGSKLQDAYKTLEEALEIAEQLNLTETSAEIRLSLGNTAEILSHNITPDKQKDKQTYIQKALENYRQVLVLSQKPITQLQAQVNELHLLVESGKFTDTQILQKIIQSKLTTISASRQSIYLRINFAQSLTSLRKKTGSNNPSMSEIAQIVKTGLEQAFELQDFRAQAYTLGTLGNLYEQTQQWTEAQKLTQQALKIAQGIQASDITYRWQWQLGRILKAQSNNKDTKIAYEKKEQAKIAYGKAVKLLKNLRYDLVTVNRDVQFSFRDEVEPVYREFVSLLLQETQNTTPVSQENLQTARDVIEQLQLAEINDFLRKACLDISESSQLAQIDEIDKNAAVVYPVILPNKLAVIVSFPNQPKDKSFSLYTADVSSDKLENTIKQFRNIITGKSFDFIPYAQDLYNWLIRPIEPNLKKNKVKNIVFVLDGALRNIPMGALYDGKEYLIQKEYNIALTPGLRLLPSQSTNPRELRAILGGLANIPKDLPDVDRDLGNLDNVPQELKAIQNIKGENSPKQFASQIFLDNDFTSDKIRKAVQSISAPFVHLATHGQFSSNPENTFILAADGRVEVNEISSILKARDKKNQLEPIELLVLSACDTAAGDNRAALGLAGVAIQSGARSTLATLWSVNDASTKKAMINFYDNLVNKKMTKAEALRQVQINFFKDEKYSHPYFWAPYVMVGNWR